MKETIKIDSKHRIVLRKILFKGSYAWAGSLEKKYLLLGWQKVQDLGDAWDFIYGMSHFKIVKEAEKVKLNILESLTPTSSHTT